MPRFLKRRRTIGNEGILFLEVATPSKGLGRDDFSSGTIREDVDVCRELQGILVHDRSSFVINAL